MTRRERKLLAVLYLVLAFAVPEILGKVAVYDILRDEPMAWLAWVPLILGWAYFMSAWGFRTWRSK